MESEHNIFHWQDSDADRADWLSGLSDLWLPYNYDPLRELKANGEVAYVAGVKDAAWLVHFGVPERPWAARPFVIRRVWVNLTRTARRACICSASPRERHPDLSWELIGSLLSNESPILPVHCPWARADTQLFGGLAFNIPACVRAAAAWFSRLTSSSAPWA